MSVPDTTRPQTLTLDQIQRPEDLRALPDEALPAVVEGRRPVDEPSSPRSIRI